MNNEYVYLETKNTSQPDVRGFISTSVGTDSIIEVAVIGPSLGTVRVVVARTVSVVLIFKN